MAVIDNTLALQYKPTDLGGPDPIKILNALSQQDLVAAHAKLYGAEAANKAAMLPAQIGHLNAQTEQARAAAGYQRSMTLDFGGVGGDMPVGGAAGPASAPSNDRSVPRGIRNNNPLNIEAGAYTQGSEGYTGSDGRFARFATPEHGLRAADGLLQTYARKGLNTTAGIIGRWAPADDGNDVPAYSGYVAKKLGVTPTTPLDMGNAETRRKVIGAMSEIENGVRKPNTVTTGEMPIAAPGTVMAPPHRPGGINDYQILKFGLNREPTDAEHELVKAHGPADTMKLINNPEATISDLVKPNVVTRNGGRPDMTARQYTQMIDDHREIGSKLESAGPTDVNPDILTGLQQSGRSGLASAVQAVAEGRAKATDYFRGRGVTSAQLLPFYEMVKQYSPSFDTTNASTRQQTRNAFAKGVEGRNVTSNSTLVNHLGAMSDAMEKMDNYKSGEYSVATKTMNETRTLGMRHQQDPRVKAADVIGNAVANEAEKAFRGSGTGSEKGIDEFRKGFSPAMSPEETKASIGQMVTLMRGRLDELAQQYNRGMGTNITGYDLLSSSAKRTLDRLMAAPGAKPVGVPSPAPATAPGGAAPSSGGVRKFNPATGMIE